MAQQEYIRFLYYQEGQSIRAISRQTGHHRHTIRRCLEGPRERRAKPQSVCYPVLGPYISVIETILEEDARRRPKDRHTARRIYQRLRDEHGYGGGESTVREYVRRRTAERAPADVHLALRFAPGQSMQVDWGEATVLHQGREVLLPFFCARLAYSTDIFVRLYPHSRMEAFLDGLRRALEHFGGVPREIVFDNLRTAVRNLTGGVREETERFVEFRTHYVFQSRFCNVGQAHEKGLVENLVGFARRNFLVPIPEVASLDPQGLETINKELEKGCLSYRNQKQSNKNETIKTLYEEEKQSLLALPEHPFACAERREAHVDSSARVRFENNHYSVPYRYAGQWVELKAFVDHIEIVTPRGVIASHARCYGKHEQHLELDHYLEVLRCKPGGLRDFRGWQDRTIPALYDQLLEHMATQRSVKEFIDVLILRRDHADPVAVDEAVAMSLARRCPHYDGIRQLLARVCSHASAPVPATVPAYLQDVRVQEPNVAQYAQLGRG